MGHPVFRIYVCFILVCYGNVVMFMSGFLEKKKFPFLANKSCQASPSCYDVNKNKFSRNFTTQKQSIKLILILYFITLNSQLNYTLAKERKLNRKRSYLCEMVNLCNLVASLVLIFRTYLRKQNLSGYISEIQNMFVLLNSFSLNKKNV